MRKEKIEEKNGKEKNKENDNTDVFLYNII